MIALATTRGFYRRTTAIADDASWSYLDHLHLWLLKFLLFFHDCKYEKYVLNYTIKKLWGKDTNYS